MTVIARDGVASDHLVYAWPFPIGPECDVTCRDDEHVVMCPSWMVGDRLGPGHHRYRTPDPSRPVGAYFVLLAPVEVQFDMITSFMMPMSGLPVRLRATGSIQVRCTDPALLIAQFVGLPFDHINDGITRSISRSVERMIARLLTRRVLMANTPMAVTDPAMKPSIIDELVAYNPAAGAVFGIEMIRMGHLTIAADDGTSPYFLRGAAPVPVTNGNGHAPAPAPPMSTTQQGAAPAPYTPRRTSMPPIDQHDVPPPIRAIETSIAGIRTPPPLPSAPPQSAVSGEIGSRPPPIPSSQSTASGEIGSRPPPIPSSQSTASGEISSRPKSPSGPQAPRSDSSGGAAMATTSGEIVPRAPKVPEPRHAAAIETPRREDDITQPLMSAPVIPGMPQLPPLPPPPPRSSTATLPPPLPSPPSMMSPPERPTPTPVPTSDTAPSRGAIMGIGMSQIGSGGVAGEIPTRIKPGGRVLVPGPSGLMQSATVRQLLQGYYELEVGSSGETIWVPVNGVIPE
ncbi:MAG: hypothetical protein NT062_31300 [Proteobacteria bacterium]|nr:hypothetical protein [Pseudomonadota bacterium]